MSDLIALTRLSIVRSSTTLVIAIAYYSVLCLGLLAYATASPVQTEELSKTVSACILIFSLPLLGITFALFDCNERMEAGTSATGYLHWLFRIPMRSWKLAVVPLALKTLWVLLICGTIVLISGMVGGHVQRWLAPALGLATLAHFACLIFWYPFRSDFTRLAVCGISFVPSYGWLIYSVSFAFLRPGEGMLDFPYAVAAHSAIIVSTYVVITYLAVHAVIIGRCHARGRIPEQKRWFNKSTQTVATSAAINLRFANPPIISPCRAILKYDLAKLNGLGARIVGVGWLCTIALWAVADNVAVPAIVFLAVVLMFPPIFLNEWMSASLDGKLLPRIMATAPVPSATIAWSRQLVFTIAWLVSLSGLPLVMLIWSWTGASDRLAIGWNEFASQQFPQANSGYQVLLALGLFLVLLTIRQSTWSVLALAIGDRRWVYWSIAIKFAIGFIIFSWFIYHFVRFPSWEAWSQWAWMMIAKIPSVLPWLFLLKLILVSTATIALLRSRLTSRINVAALLLSLTLLTTAIALTFQQLIPSDNVTLWHYFAVVTLMIPASRILLAPVALAHGRHQ